ncbi:MAG: phosphate acetyltransferase [Coriobacteriales bacterium]
MSDFLPRIIERAKRDIQTIVFPEGADSRVVEAARAITDQGIARCVVLGSQEELAAHGVSLEGIQTVDPALSADAPRYAEKLAELRAKKGMTLEQAAELVKDVTTYGVMMVYFGDADGMVSGACHSTADTLRPCLQILKTAPGVKLVSSSFVMDVPECELGDGGLFVFGDCALNLYPSADELAEIAVASARTFADLCGGEPRVAMLSFSTQGSGKGEGPAAVREAAELARQKAPGLLVDGELQADAAIVASVGASKAPGSAVAGSANVLIFPNIDAGNIGYKLVQRLAKAEAYGPVMQGLAKPVSDLSRGCSVADIVGTCAITCVQAIAAKA